MAVKTKPIIGRNFEWQIPQVVVALPRGRDSRTLYEAHLADADERFSGNEYLKVAYFATENNEIQGSNVFLNAHINELVSPLGIRTAVPADDRFGDISRLIKDRFYTDFNSLVARSNEYSFDRNNPLLQRVIALAEQHQGRVRFPFMLEGFYVAPLQNDSQGYGMTIVPAKNFRIIEDERLDGKKYPTGTRFNDVDEVGLPRFDKKGKRTWYARDNGLSRLLLDGGLALVSGDAGLAYSGRGGRVVLISGEASSRPIFREVKKKEEIYTPMQIALALNKVGIRDGLENQILDSLREK